MTVERIAPADLRRALAAARPGDHLYVDAGELKGQLTIDKAITIEGSGHGTWLGNTTGPVIRVLARGVHLKDLDIDAGGPDEIAIWLGAEPPRLDGVSILRGKYGSAGITFAPPPVIQLCDAPERRRMSTAPGPVAHAAPISQPPPAPPHTRQPTAPPAPPPRARRPTAPMPQPRTRPSTAPPAPPPRARQPTAPTPQPRTRPPTGPPAPPSRARPPSAPTPQPQPPAPLPQPRPPSPSPRPRVFGWSIAAAVLAATGLVGAAIFQNLSTSKTPSADDTPPPPAPRTCDDGDATACRRDGRPDRACTLGDGDGCLQWGQSLESSDAKQAVAAYTKACERGLADGCQRAEALRIEFDPCDPITAQQIYDLTSPDPKPRPIDRKYWNDALAKGLDVARRMPDCPQVANALAHIYFRVNYSVCADGDTAEAGRLIDKANAEQPDDAFILRNRGRVLAARGQFEAALEDFRRSEGLHTSGQTREWIESISALLEPRAEMVTAARAVLEGVELSEERVAALEPAERLVVSKAVGASFGRSSELQAIDRFYFCQTNPDGLRLEFDESVGSNLDLTLADRHNLRLLRQPL